MKMLREIMVLLVLFGSGFVWEVKESAATKYDFLYVISENPYPAFEYRLIDGKVVKHMITYPWEKFYIPSSQDVRLYRHDIEKNLSLEISFEESQKYILHPGTRSPN